LVIITLGNYILGGNSLQGFFQRYLFLYRPLISKLNELLAPFDLSYSQWQIIFYVKDNGPSTLVDISTHYNVEKPTITRTVQRLEEKQIMKQVPGKDKREKKIQLTESGEEVYKACRKKITEMEHSVMKGISEEEKQAAFEILPKVRKNILNSEEDENE
jgi:MarR family transcriptional regulator, transcriptional regulator for hemolysin